MQGLLLSSVCRKIQLHNIPPVLTLTEASNVSSPLLGMVPFYCRLTGGFLFFSHRFPHSAASAAFLRISLHFLLWFFESFLFLLFLTMYSLYSHLLLLSICTINSVFIFTLFKFYNLWQFLCATFVFSLRNV